MIVVKVGGSLYDHPGLGPGLREFLTPLLHRGPVRLVPGGGPFADVVRLLDRLHGLGEEASHWLALRSLSAAALFLESLLPVTDGLSVLDPYEFARADEGRPGFLPHSWDVTSDSVAARVAVVEGAERLVLLKSLDLPPGTSWPEAAARGWVDPYFPTIVDTHGIPAEVINFRRRLDGR